MERKLLDSIRNILLAFVVSVVIWVNATYVNDRPEQAEFPISIPIEVVNAPAGLIATNDPIRSVTIEIRAFSSSWEKLTQEHFRVIANWGALQEGESAVPLEYSCSDRTVSIESVEPQTQFVTLEAIKTLGKEITVDLQDQQEIPLGYRVKPPEVDPERVSMTGPASAVNRVASLRVAISVFNQTTSIERIAEPIPHDEAGNIVQGVTLDPRTVNIKVTIEKKQNYREVVVRARTIGQPAQGYFVSDVDLVPSTVTIIGPPDVIEPMGGLVDLIREVDISGATRMVSDKLPLELPESVSVLGTQEGQTFEVLVTVGIDAVTGGTTVELPLKTTRLQEGLVARSSVPIVDVILTGPSVLIDELETNLLNAYLDLSGLGEGTHQVRPQVEIIVSQDSQLRNLVIKDISPQSVEVIISQPPTPTATPTLELTPTPTMKATDSITGTAALSATVNLIADITATATSIATETPPTSP